MPIDTVLQLRPARAEDARALVPLIYGAGSAAFDYILAHGRHRAADFLQFALADGRGLIGWRNHHVAVLGGRVVGSAAFYSGVEVRALSIATLRQFFRFSPPWQALQAMHRAGLLGDMQPVPRLDEWYIAHLSVDPAYRSRGIAAQLLEYGTQLARRYDKRSCVLDVADNNLPACQLYARLGFRSAGLRRFSVAAAGIPASRRMWRKLDVG